MFWCFLKSLSKEDTIVGHLSFFPNENALQHKVTVVVSLRIPHVVCPNKATVRGLIYEYMLDSYPLWVP